MPKIGETPWTAHKRLWKGCTRCGLCEHRKNVVLARGSLPCDVLFVGEAPGDSEDCSGLPFDGPAGQEFDKIIANSISLRCAVCGGIQMDTTSGVTCEQGHGGADEVQLKLAWTNLVACMPKEEDELGRLAKTEPPDWAIQACAPRLDALIKMADPQVIVRVGALSSTWLDMSSRIAHIPQFDVIHPAAIIRANVASQDMMRRKAVISLSEATEAIRPRAVVGKVR